jgi:FKBP-type peptidyl-prolyl cis-trans isomerase
MRAARRTFVLLSLAGVLASCGDSTTAPTEVSLEDQKWGASLGIDLSTMTKLASGVYIKDLVVGTGSIPVKPSSHISVTYTGYYASGVVFTKIVGTPQEYLLSDLIEGWKLGLPGVVAGGQRRLVIPSALAYRASGYGPIPPYANLVFDIAVVTTD